MADSKQKVAADAVNVAVVGRLGGEPESRQTRNGKRISSASIAVGQRKKNAAGHWEDGETMWFRLICFGSDLDSYSKGDKVRVNGRLSMSKWENRSGEMVTSYEILLSDKDPISLEAKPKPKADNDYPASDEYPES